MASHDGPPCLFVDYFILDRYQSASDNGDEAFPAPVLTLPASAQRSSRRGGDDRGHFGLAASAARYPSGRRFLTISARAHCAIVRHQYAWEMTRRAHIPRGSGLASHTCRSTPDALKVNGGYGEDV